MTGHLGASCGHILRDHDLDVLGRAGSDDSRTAGHDHRHSVEPVPVGQVAARAAVAVRGEVELVPSPQRGSVAKLTPMRQTRVEEVEEVDAVAARVPSLGRTRTVALERTPAEFVSLAANSRVAEAGVDRHAVLVSQLDAVLPRVEPEIARRDEHVHEPVREPALHVEPDAFGVFDRVRHADRDQDGPAPLHPLSLGHLSHPSQEARHHVQFLLPCRLPVGDGFEEACVPEEVELYPVHVVILADLFDDAEAEIADHRLGIVHRTPRAVLWALGLGSDDALRVVLLELRERDGPVPRARRVVSVVHAQGPEDFDGVLLAVLHHDAQRVGSLRDERGHGVVAVIPLPAGEQLAHLGVVCERGEALGRGVEDRVHLGAPERGRPDFKQPLCVPFLL